MKLDTAIAPFKVVVLYDSLPAGTHAFEVFQRLIDLFGNDYLFENQLFKLNALLTPAFARQAAHDTSQADMIIIAVGDERELTPDFRNWALAWPSTTVPSDRILVALLDRNLLANCAAGRRAKFLRELAAHHGMDFLCNVEENGAPHGQAASFMGGVTEVEQPVRMIRGDRVVMNKRGRLKTTRPVECARWGLNE